MKELTIADKICDKHKYITPYDIGGCPVGWERILDKHCDRIDQVLADAGIDPSNLEVLQLKEKFGQLRLYVEYKFNNFEVQHQIDTIIQELENETDRACAFCGGEAKWYSTGWVLPYCQDCADVSFKRRYGKNSSVGFADFFKPIAGKP